MPIEAMGNRRFGKDAEARGDGQSDLSDRADPNGEKGPSRYAPFEDPEIAARYESWYRGEGRRADGLEKRLLTELLQVLRPCRSILEIGCGTGHFSRWFAQQTGARVVGLDRSMEMLRRARPAVHTQYVCGDAGALPFADRAFDVAAFVTALEFVEDPRVAVAEAFRVARRGVLIGALNRHSLLGWRLRRRGGPIWSNARLLTVGEARQLACSRSRDGAARIVVRTSLWPLWPGSFALPWGGFIGLAATMPDRSAGEEEP